MDRFIYSLSLYVRSMHLIDKAFLCFLFKCGKAMRPIYYYYYYHFSVYKLSHSSTSDFNISPRPFERQQPPVLLPLPHRLTVSIPGKRTKHNITNETRPIFKNTLGVFQKSFVNCLAESVIPVVYRPHSQ